MKEELDEFDEALSTNPYEGEFEGIIPMLKRWFAGTNSTETLREWVEKYMELKTCLHVMEQD